MLFCCCSRPGCSKLTMSSVNVSLKFQMLKYANIFVEKLLQCSAKAFLSFFNKIFSVFGYKTLKL